MALPGDSETGLESQNTALGLESRKRIEQALLASETRYRRLFESAKEGILILDAESGDIIDVNPFLAELLGYPRADFIGAQVWDFGPFRGIVASKEAFHELEAMDSITYDDLPLETIDGKRIDVSLVSNVYLVDDKRIIQCNIRDLTNRKVAEKAWASLEEQLRASQNMDAIGGLAGGLAHDVNNLLSVILCYTGFALEALPDGDPLRDDLREVEKASKVAAALTRQLLAFSRKQILQPVALDVNHIVEGIARMLRRVLGEPIELVHALDPELGMVVADPGQLEQVILNLVVNARDAMPGGGKLTIETANVELDAAYTAQHVSAKPGSYIVLAITDTGCGMDAETQARVFEPFFTTKAPGKGTGLGLSTVYGIVKQTGGNVWVYSEPGLGTTFKVYLPRELSAIVTRSRTPASMPVKAGSETILVVEDEAAVRNLARRILAAAGYNVLTAANGRDALLLCESHEGDLHLVLTDVVMPQVGGRTFAARLRLLRPATRILFMSGYSDGAIFHHGVLEVGTRFIGKPFNASDLARTIRQMLDEPADAAVPAAPAAP